MDPYINVDAGAMSPFQHGEVFVTDEPAYVALTEKVRVALRLKQLVEVSKKEHDAYWSDKDARLKEMATFNSERDLVADPLATVPEIIAERAAFEKQNAERLAESNEPEQKEAEAPKPESTPVTSKKAGAK